MEYTYAADGRKLSTFYYAKGGGAGSLITDYIDNMIYEGGSLKRILIEGGYIKNGVYYFYIQDHLGNNRAVAKADGIAVQTTHCDPYGALFYDSWSPTKQPYLYNNKELDSKGGLDWYDYGARHYDPVLGRFATMDPMAEKYYSWSPYAYCLGNPVNLVDPDGMAPG